MNFSLAISAVAPLVIYLALGALLGRRRQISGQTASEINRLLYLYCFPLLMANNIYRSDLQSSFNLPFVLLMLGLTLLTTVVALLVLPRFFKDKKALGSMIQGILRGNVLLFALPVVQTISGEENTGLISLCVATVVPAYNIICVIILERLRGEKVRPLAMLVRILANPIILGALAGILLKVSGIRLPQALDKVIGELGALVTPAALILLGSNLRFADLRAYRRELAVVSLAKLLLIPALTVGAARLFGFGPLETTTAMALSAVPTAVASYVMAREMSADAVLAGQIVALTTTLSALSVFLWVLALSGLGWLG